MTTDNTDTPRVTLGDAVRTTVGAYQAEVDALDDRGQDYAIDLCRRFFGFMKTWASLDTEDLEQQDREAVIVLRQLYADVHGLYIDRPDRTALSLALSQIVEAGWRYGVDIREDAGEGDEPFYPEESVVRDVARQLVIEHVQRMISTSLPQHAAAMLITRSGETGRTDLVEQLVDESSDVRKRMLAALGQVLSTTKHDAIAILRTGQ